jgi:Ca2+-binding RTX toxin-like protein
MRHAIVGCAVALVLAPSALAAGTISRSAANDDLNYATATAANVVVTDAPDGAGGAVVTVTETGISIMGPANGCMDNGDSIACPFAAGNDPRVDANLTAQPDKFDGGAANLTVLTVFSMGGNDELTGGNDVLSRLGNPTGDSLFPGTGTDRVIAGDGTDQVGLGDDGADVVDLGPGDDQLITTYAGPDAEADSLTGGPGRDEYRPRFVTVAATSFTVDLAAGTSVDSDGASAPDPISGFEDLRTDEGNDTLLGDAGSNELRGGAGNDRLDGRLGVDQLFGEFDADRLEARDGVADRVDGGTEADVCLLDQLDIDTDCETREIANVTPFGVVFPDVTAPACVVSAARRPRARRVARRGLLTTMDCDEPGTVTARLVGRLRRLGQGASAARAGDIELSRRTTALSQAGNATLRLRVARRYRGLLRRGTRLRLAVVAVDAAGNRARPTVRRLRLR